MESKLHIHYLPIYLMCFDSRGMGFHISQQLANHGAKVYIAARSENSAMEAIRRIESENSATKNSVFYLNLDLSTLKGAQEAGKIFSQSESRLDILSENSCFFSVDNSLNETSSS